MDNSFSTVAGRELNNLIATVVTERNARPSTETTSTKRCRLQSTGRTDPGPYYTLHCDLIRFCACGFYALMF